MGKLIIQIMVLGVIGHEGEKEMKKAGKEGRKDRRKEEQSHGGIHKIRIILKYATWNHSMENPEHQSP